MIQRTASEALQRYVDCLGPTFGPAYHHACQHLWHVVSYWDRYETLFGTKGRVDVLNENSGNFWYAVQNMLFEYVLLGISRLTDRPSVAGRSNLTIRRLLELDSSEDKAELALLVAAAEEQSIFARSWRNARIAHNDLDEITGEAATRLLPATRDKVRTTLIAIHEVLRWINLKHFQGEMHLWPLGDDDANIMMQGLADGNAVRRARLAAIERKDWAGAELPDYPWKTSGADRNRYSEAAPRVEGLPTTSDEH